MTYLAILLFISILILWGRINKISKEKSKFIKNSITEKDNLIKEINSKQVEIERYKAQTEPLKKYQNIKNADDELQRLINQMEIVTTEATDEATRIKKEARIEAKEIRYKAEAVMDKANVVASKITANAKRNAKNIAGDAYEAKLNADQYAETVKAMKNIISGYGDEYLIPNHSLLDDLAEEYSHKDAGQALAQLRIIVKSMIKNEEAADCDYVDNYRRATAIEFVLDAFNGKVDTIMAKVKHDNYGKLLQELKDAYRLVNHNGKPFRDARVNKRYFDIMQEQLKLAVMVQELKKKDQEEQRAIREAMREEEKVRREVEKALKQAEKEEKLLEKAMREAEQKLSAAAAEERAKFEEKLEKIKQQLAEAEDRGQRALSMAQQTKRGHVYIISNVGSFGEDVIKIGLTRRLEPLDRVKELGDASVPFSFDVHAMIHSEDAPRLEKELHDLFESNRVNKINYRKEFFSLPVSEIRAKIDEMGFDTHWTMKAEAQEYRESVVLKKRELETFNAN